MDYPFKINPKIDDVGPFQWPEKDTGAWTGPVKDWQDHHKAIIKSITRKRACIQAGGNCGLYPSLLTGYFDRIHTFEPDERNYAFLKENTKFFPQVTCYNAALGSQARQVAMHIVSEENVGMHRVNEDGDGVAMFTVDSLFSHNDIIDLIWFDIEGYEFEALCGAEQTIKLNYPVIGVERSTLQVRDLLSALGYDKTYKSSMDTFFTHPSGPQIEQILPI